MSSNKMQEMMAFLLLILLQLSLVQGEITTVNITADSRELIVLSEFFFKPTGHLSISISSVSVTPPNDTTPTNSSRFGFFVKLMDYPFDGGCVIDFPMDIMLFTFNRLPQVPNQSSSFSKAINVTKAGYYHSYFGNCNAGSNVSMIVKVEAYNLNAEGQKEYLSDGETPLIKLYSYFAFFQGLFFTIWLITCYLKKPFVKKIHLLMAALVLAKALQLVLAAEDKYHINSTGTPHGWDAWFYAFNMIKGLLLFVVTVLVGTGWSILQPSLQEREKKLLMFGIPLQVFINVAEYFFRETSLSDNNYLSSTIGWGLCFMIANIIAAVLILIPIQWSIASLEEASKEDGKAAANLEKISIFKTFFITSIIYLFFNNYILLMMRDSYDDIDHTHIWVFDLIREVTTLLFFVIMFTLFGPVGSNEYLTLPSENEEEEVALFESHFDIEL